MKKSLMAFTIGLLSTCSIWAHGLGLGEIQLKSSLNEPLQAEIKLQQVRDLSPQELLVGLAPKEDFERNKVERVFYLSDLKFRVELIGKDQAVIYVTSSKPIKEPYLNFLVELNWPAGRLVREYTLLIDPPPYAQSSVTQPIVRTKNQAVLNQKVDKSSVGSQLPEPDFSTVSPVRAPKASVPAPKASSAPVAAAPSVKNVVNTNKKDSMAVSPEASRQAASASNPPAPAAAPRSPKVYEVGDSERYTVQKNETLWEVALKVKPDGVSTHQTIVALYQANKEAFIDQNMNLVKKGAVLRIPNNEEAKKVTRKEAVEEVARQSKLWQAKVQVNATSADKLTGDNIDASGRTDRVVTPDKETSEGKLTLVSSGANQGDGKGVGAGKSGSKGADLSALEEKLDQAKLHSADLKSSVKNLSTQVKTSEKVLRLKDDKIASLESRIKQLEEQNKRLLDKKAGKNTAVAQVDGAIKAPLEEIKTPANTTIQPSKIGAEPTKSEAVAPAAEATPEVAAPILSAPLSEPEVLSADPIAMPGVDQVTSPDQPEALPETSSQEPIAAIPDELVEPPALESEASMTDMLFGNPLYLALGAGVLAAILAAVMVVRKKRNDHALTDDEIEEAAEQGFSMDDLAVEEEDAQVKSGEDEAPAHKNTDQSSVEAPIIDVQDIIGEADIFLAYGRFDQAAAILQKTIKQIPNDPTLRLKLMEVFVESRDVEGFLLQEKALTSLNDSEANAKAQQLKKKLGVTPEAAQRLSQEMLEAETDEDLEAEKALYSGASKLDGDDEDDDYESNELTQGGDLPSLSDLESSLTDGFDEEEQTQVETGESDGLDFELNLDDDDDKPVAKKDFTNKTNASNKASQSTSMIDEESFELDLALFDEKGGQSIADGKRQDKLDLDELDDLDLDSFDTSASMMEAATSSSVSGFGEEDLSFDLIDLDEAPPIPQTKNVAAPSQVMPAEVKKPVVQAAAPSSMSMDDDFSFLEETDQVANSLDLAKAYLDMGDLEGAKDILNEVIEQGDQNQQEEARTLLKKMPKHA